MFDRRLPRRTFLSIAGTAAAASVFAPRAQGRPSETINVAGVGASGQAMHDLGQVDRVANIVAFADVDASRAETAQQRWPDAAYFADWRQMFDTMHSDIDAVVIACPDHTHAIAGLAAMDLGKHVYIEKPLAHNVHEVRNLMAAAKESGVATQMGNHGHSMPGVHRAKVWYERGALGAVREVHCWTNRPTWDQGIGRPTETPPVPDTLAWDLWLGPAANRPYHPSYHPRNWRGWWDFGTCALGDMGCHIFDAPYHILELGAPTRVSAEQEGATAETGPTSSRITYAFPARGEQAPVTLTWHDGGNMPDRPEGWPDDMRMGDGDGGSMLIGDQGTMIIGTYGNGPIVVGVGQPDVGEIKIDRVRGHQRHWVECCTSGEIPWSNFDYAGPLTEMVLLGNIALRTDGPIEWDGASARITNNADANTYLTREYRPGWEV